MLPLTKQLSTQKSGGFLIYGLLLISTLALLNSCKNTPEVSSQVPDFETIGKEDVRLIFFNMYLPEEMSSMFEKTGSNYEPSIMNPAENITRYTSPHSVAVNIGIYGVDLNYARFFNQNAAVAKYINTVNILAGKLGIPSDFYENMIKGIERNFNDKDSISKYASDIYINTDEYLKSVGKDSYAALIVMGGWIEALYIASKIYESNSMNNEIINRISEQKYSLNSLIALLSNYQDDTSIAGYILMLKTLKRSYDQFELYYSPADLKLDSTKMVLSAKGYQSQVTPETLKEISQIISTIRNEIVM
jgi:hypothetical protein